jgi:hypothetical protein
MTAPLTNAFARSATSRLTSAFMRGANTNPWQIQNLFTHSATENMASVTGFTVSNTASTYADSALKDAFKHSYIGQMMGYR